MTEDDYTRPMKQNDSLDIRYAVCNAGDGCGFSEHVFDLRTAVRKYPTEDTEPGELPDEGEFELRCPDCERPLMIESHDDQLKRALSMRETHDE